MDGYKQSLVRVFIGMSDKNFESHLGRQTELITRPLPIVPNDYIAQWSWDVHLSVSRAPRTSSSSRERPGSHTIFIIVKDVHSPSLFQTLRD